jgi:hypothetical protein
MQFVIIFGQGRFLSRHVHQVILDVIDRAMAAFSATGMNPDRYTTHFCSSFGSEINADSFICILHFFLRISLCNFVVFCLVSFGLHRVPPSRKNKRMKNKVICPCSLLPSSLQ